MLVQHEKCFLHHYSFSSEEEFISCVQSCLNSREIQTLPTTACFVEVKYVYSATIKTLYRLRLKDKQLESSPKNITIMLHDE